MNVVDLNADVGESYGLMHSGIDSEIIPHVTSVNIATGFHSGDPDTIKKTVELALSYSKSIGAHPSYPDLQGFGRRKIDMDIDSIENLISYQVGALHAFSKDLQTHHSNFCSRTLKCLFSSRSKGCALATDQKNRRT